jgi:hypothetical protein
MSLQIALLGASASPLHGPRNHHIGKPRRDSRSHITDAHDCHASPADRVVKPREVMTHVEPGIFQRKREAIGCAPRLGFVSRHAAPV